MPLLAIPEEIHVGIFDKWKDYKETRRVKRIESNKNLIRRDKVAKEERAAAIEFFCDLSDSTIAVPALLKRFDFSADNGIVDTREKERALDGITSRGSEAVPLIIDHLKNSTRIAWPVKALSKLVEEKEVAETLHSCLDYGDVSFDQAKVDKNYDLLCYLADYKLHGLSEKLSHFLNVHDERVRYAAAELLVLQDDKEVPTLLEKFTYDESEENRRLKKTVFEAFSEKGWKLSNPEKGAETSPAGFRVSKEGLVSKA